MGLSYLSVVFATIACVQTAASQELDTQPDLSHIQITPHKQAIVLLGQTISVYLYFPDAQPYCVSLIPDDSQRSPAWIRIFPTERCFQKYGYNNITKHVQFHLSGLKTGRKRLDIVAYQPGSSNASQYLISSDYEVIVTEQLNVIHDAFIYILGSIQFLAMMLLGLRMRGAATKEILLKPCALISALVCQVVCLPLICLGVALALGLGELPAVSLLLIGCCPTAAVTCVLAVIQQAHVELAIVLLILQTVTALGTMPGWLFAYGHVLGVAYADVSFPYYHIVATIAAVALPTLIGVGLRRCTPRVLPQLDKAIQPSSLLVVLVAVTVSIYNFIEKFPLVTWQLLLATALIPLICMLTGGLLCIIFRQRIPQTKSVAIVTSLQNTLLAATIVQTSYPVEQSSVMAVTLACMDFMTLSTMFVMYLMHMMLWVMWPVYRMNHDNCGISGISKSFSEKLVRNMLRAGEIHFCSRANNRRKYGAATPYFDTGNLTTNGQLRGSLGNIDKILNNNSGVKGMINPLGGLNLAFLGLSDTFRRKETMRVERLNDGTDSESDLSLQYFATPRQSDLAGETSKLHMEHKDAENEASIINKDGEDDNVKNKIVCQKTNDKGLSEFDVAQSNIHAKLNEELKTIMDTDRNCYANCSRTDGVAAGEICNCATSDKNKADTAEQKISQDDEKCIMHDQNDNAENKYSGIPTTKEPGVHEDDVGEGTVERDDKQDTPESIVGGAKEDTPERVVGGANEGIHERVLDHVDPMFENQMNEQSEAECSIWQEERL